MKDVVHQPLKSLSSFTEAVGHVSVLKEAKRSDHRRFRNVWRVNRNLVISFHQIKFGENGGTMETRGKILEIGKRITVGVVARLRRR